MSMNTDFSDRAKARKSEGFDKSGYAKTTRKKIRDSRNFIVGYEVRVGDRTTYRDAGGIDQGYYDHNTDRTYKPGGIMSSYGNTGVSLVFKGACGILRYLLGGR